MFGGGVVDEGGGGGGGGKGLEAKREGHATNASVISSWLNSGHSQVIGSRIHMLIPAPAGASLPRNPS